MERPDLRTSVTEVTKLAFEAFKHLATLNAGAIVLIGTFLQGIFPSKDGTLLVGPVVKVLIVLSFVCFGVSLGLAVLTMRRYTNLLRTYLLSLNLDHRSREDARVASIQAWTLFLFWLGLVAFGLAVVLNLYQ
jgi:hypothetical protein